MSKPFRSADATDTGAVVLTRRMTTLVALQLAYTAISNSAVVKQAKAVAFNGPSV